MAPTPHDARLRPAPVRLAPRAGSRVRRLPRDRHFSASPAVAALGLAATLAASSVLAPVPAFAGAPLEALSVAWDNCPLSGGSVRVKDFTCDTNLGSSSLYCAFSVLEPIDQIVGFELVVDVQHSNAILPNWWRLGPSPECRHDVLTASIDFSPTDACVDPGFTGAVLQDYLVTQPRGLPSQARIKAVVFVPSPETRAVSNDTTYLAARLILSNDRTVNVDACAGCVEPACLVLNSILVRRVAGAPGGDIALTTPAAAQGNWAYWRNQSGAECSWVPVRTVTWGRVKSLYR